jgi:hypothetical protein
VGSAADLLYAVACRHLEVNSLSLDVDYLGRRAHLVAHRRGREVLYIYCSADRAFTCIQNGLMALMFLWLPTESAAFIRPDLYIDTQTASPPTATQKRTSG